MKAPLRIKLNLGLSSVWARIELGMLSDLKMKRVRTRTVRTVRTMLTHEYPYPHEHSQHALLAVVAVSLFFIFSDNLHIVLHKLDKNIKWWSIYAFLLGFFYFFSSPFLGKTIQPSYSNFSRWQVNLLFIPLATSGCIVCLNSILRFNIAKLCLPSSECYRPL